jgi:hypothetical protein
MQRRTVGLIGCTAIRGMGALAIVILTACGSSDPVPMGKDTYTLSGTAPWSWSSGGEVKGDLFRKADAFCRSKGKRLMPINTVSNDASFSQFAHAEVDFRCLDPGDPELGRPNLQPVPNVRIQTQSD